MEKSNIQFYTVSVRTFVIPFYFLSGSAKSSRSTKLVKSFFCCCRVATRAHCAGSGFRNAASCATTSSSTAQTVPSPATPAASPLRGTPISASTWRPTPEKARSGGPEGWWQGRRWRRRRDGSTRRSAPIRRAAPPSPSGWWARWWWSRLHQRIIWPGPTRSWFNNH